MTTATNTANTVVMNALSRDSAGGLIGWSGRGEISRTALIGVLERAGCPTEYAPARRSNRRVLTDVLGAVHAKNVVKSLCPSLPPDEHGNRLYEVRWTLARKTDAAEVGDSVGLVAATFDLRDGDDTLYVDPGTDPEMVGICAEISSEYARLRDDVYKAAAVSQWLAATLVGRFGAVRYSTGWFVPADRLDGAAALCRELSRVWGANWTDPPTIGDAETGGLGYLPVTTSAGLARGVAATFHAEVVEVERALDREADSARANGRDDVSAKVAIRYLRILTELSDRAVSYRALCGDEYLAPTRQRLTSMEARLNSIATDAEIRFSLLETDKSPVEIRDDRRFGLAARRADAAAAVRRGEVWPTPKAPAPVVPTPCMADDSSSARFGLLELD